MLVAMLVTLSACGIDRFDAKGWAGLAVDDDALYVTSGEGRVFALNVSGDAEGSGGRPVQLYSPFPSTSDDPLGAVYSTPVLGAYEGGSGPGAQSIFLATYQDPEEDDDFPGNVYALNAGTGIQNWSTILPGRIVGTPALAGNSLIVGTDDGSLHAIALPEDGSALPGRTWPAFEADGKIWSRPAVDNGTLYFGTLGHTVYAVSLADGRELWSVSLDGAIVGTPLVLNGTVYVGALDRTLYALNSANGEEKWRFEGDGWFWSPPVFDDGVIYAATLRGSLYALDTLGNRLWTVPAQASGAIVAAPQVLANSVVVATTEKFVHQFSLLDGHEEWSIGVGDQVRADMASQGEVVYLIDSEGVVHALHTGQRRELWTYQTQE